MIEECCSHCVCVKKRNGEIRLTCDYRSINLMTLNNAYGMAELTELIERAAKAKYVSTINLASDYWHVAMSHASKMLTSFRTRRGLSFNGTLCPRA